MFVRLKTSTTPVMSGRIIAIITVIAVTRLPQLASTMQGKTLFKFIFLTFFPALLFC